MGIQTVLVSSEDHDGGDPGSRRFGAVNLALEMDQGGLELNTFKDPNLTTPSSDASSNDDVVVKGLSDSCSSSEETHSTSSRTGDSIGSEPASSSSEPRTDSSSGNCNLTPDLQRPANNKTDNLLQIVQVSPASAASKPADGEAQIQSVKIQPADGEAQIQSVKIQPADGEAQPIQTVKMPTLLSFVPAPELKKQKGLRHSIARKWTSFKKIRTFPRDVRALQRYLKLLYRMRTAKQANVNLPQVFDRTTAKHPHKVAFYFEEQTWTFAQVQAYSHRIANLFRAKVAKGDAVALLMENRVEYIAIWLGLARIGVVPALINTNLRQQSLSHCITSASCKLVICGVELQDALMEIKSDIASVPVYVSGPGLAESGSAITVPGALNLDSLERVSPATAPAEEVQVNFSDKLLYIYTSGTTGLPKAAVITHSRFIFASIGMLTVVGVRPSDVLYGPLPLYHTAGVNLGVGMVLCDGVSFALRKKFSVSNYMPDCHKYGCTVGQYIGEICRYLLNSPPSPQDKQHKMRVMFGNGLRPQIWEQFQDRFNIPRMAEFYGSTEGNANIINMEGRVGAVGFLSVLLPSFYPCALIRIDSDTGKPVRDSNGVCIRCLPGEPGEFVGKIIANDPVREFKGYADKKATSTKIIYDVFKKGDSAFLSGDILVMDEEGYLFFKDRTGDTFRWKGENVSTAEVENHLSGMVNSQDVSVYGVEIPNTEGRAGMAAVLDPEGNLNLATFAKGVTSALPAYARPLFLRTVPHIEMTGTYKLRKTDLQKEGFDVTVIKDPIYMLDARQGVYNRLSPDTYNKIISGEMRL